MKKLKAVIILSFIVASACNASALPPPFVDVPEGTPQRIEGFSGQSLYTSYRDWIGQEVEHGSTSALSKLRVKSGGNQFGTPNLRRHGVSFSYNPSTQSDEREKVQGRVYHTCRAKIGCDWVMEMATVPDFNAQDWAYEHFDAEIAAASLKEKEIIFNGAGRFIGHYMSLPSPKKSILDSVKEQLYFGKKCPEFVEVLAAEAFGQERVKALLSLSTPGEEASAATHVEGAIFDISIAETADEFENSRNPPPIDMKFSGTRGDAVGNKLVESIKGCKNKAGRYK